MQLELGILLTAKKRGFQLSDFKQVGKSIVFNQEVLK
jgi:hypothetical protein